jgi:ubiquinone/menaquinone biosynthesis C-methylase UbiE
MGFEQEMATRGATTYATFLLERLAPEARVVDVGCGAGTITVGMAASVGEVVGVDLDDSGFAAAREWAEARGVANVTFRPGSAYALPEPGRSADGVLAHSVLEALERPADALAEMHRVLRPGGIAGVACVDYGGLLLAGPDIDLIRESNSVRERVWLASGSDPFLGRRLRGLLGAAGFVDIEATSVYLTYGTADAVRWFGEGRAAECGDEEYAEEVQRHGLADRTELGRMRDAWLAWAESPSAFAAFAWCRAVARAP